MAEASVRIKATDETKAAFASVARSMRGLESSAAGIRAAFGAIAGGAGAAFLYKSAAAFIEAEQASARLEATLKATGNAVGKTKEQLDELAETLASTTQFDDESIRNASASLIKFGNISGQAFERALKAAMDWAAFTGEELPAAAQTIGAALSASEGGLGRLERQLGKLTYEEERFVKELEASGDVLGAQGEKLRIIESRISGVADAMNRGLGGAVRAVNKEWGEFLEGFGRTATEAGRFERVARGAATLLRDITLESQGTRTPLRNLAEDILGVSARVLESLPGLGLFVRLLRQAQVGARIQALGGQRAEGKIKGLGQDEAEASAEAARVRAFWDAEAKKGDEITKRLTDEEKKQREKSAAEFIARENALREKDIQGWVAHADAVLEQADRENLALAKIAEDFYEREEQIRAKDLDGWVRYADEVLDIAAGMVDTWTKTGERMSIPREQWEEMQKEAQSLEDVARDLGMTFSSAFEDAIVAGKQFSEVLKGIAQDILRIIARETVTKPLAGAVMSVLGPILKGIFPGGKATGGPVSGGQPYIVGERGPELFVPATSGNVVPNHALGGGVTVNVAVDARGATGSGDPAQTGRTIGALVADAVRRELINQQRAGGILAT